MMRFEKGRCHQARVAGRREKRQERETLGRVLGFINMRHSVSKHFMVPLKSMLSFNHCSRTDWIYSLPAIPVLFTTGPLLYKMKVVKSKDNLPKKTLLSEHFVGTSQPFILSFKCQVHT